MSERRSALRPPLRRGLLAGAVVFLTLLGSGTATALWSAQRSVDPFTATAATVGVSHSVGTGLEHTYSASALAAAQAVTVTNTGNREAAFSIEVSATSSSDLRSHVTAQLAVVANEAACTPSASLSSPVTGALSSPVTLSSAPAALAAGASVVVCVQTVMTAVTGHDGKSLTGSIVSSTVASPQSGWSASTADVTFAQAVETPSSPLFNDPWARYGVKHEGVCVGGIWNRTEIAKGYSCGANQLTEWLLKLTEFGTYNIEVAYNAHLSAQPLWAATASDTVEKESHVQAQHKRWQIALRADGRYKFVNEQSGLCATVSTEQVETTSSFAIVLTACDDSRLDQGFQIEIIAQATFPPVTLTCVPHGPEMHYSWPVLQNYQHAVTYEVFIGGVFYGTHDNGHYTTVQLERSDLGAYASGTHLIEIYQSVHGGQWTLTGSGYIVKPPTGPVSCG